MKTSLRSTLLVASLAVSTSALAAKQASGAPAAKAAEAAKATAPGTSSAPATDAVPTSAPPAATAPVTAPTQTITEKIEDKKISVSGYVAPEYGFTYRPEAVSSKTRYEYGASGAAGVAFTGEPDPRLKFVLSLTLEPPSRIVSDASFTSAEQGASGDTLSVTFTRIAKTLLEEFSATYKPMPMLSLKLGQMRMPFTIPQRSANTALMFPTRAGPNQVFLSGSDQGVQATIDPADGRLLGIIGAFNGTSLGLLDEFEESRGPSYCARVDAMPLGKFGFSEGDLDRGPLRIGVGAGLIYRPAVQFDSKGFDSVQLRDFRFAASFRAAMAGFYFQAEYLRRQRTDSFTNRPLTASGAYAQTSYFLPLTEKFAISPMARLGYAIVDELIEPRSTAWLEAGISFFPFMDPEDPNAVRLILAYQGERRIIEGENAHGLTTQLQIGF